MKTKILSEKDLEQAAQQLRKGSLVAFPTETVYGLGADATNEEAINQIFLAKGRPSDNPLIVHLASYEEMSRYAQNIPSYVKTLVEHFSPGPLTYILEDRGLCAKNVTAGLNTVGLRIPNHPLALELIKKSQRPLAAPSANLSGKPSPTSADHVFEDLNGRIPYILDGGTTEVGLESTVIDCTKDFPLILRHGEVTQEMLEEVMPVGLSEEEDLDRPRSPGMKYKHYAPAVPLVLITSGLEALKNEIKQHSDKRVAFLVTSKTADSLGDVSNIYILGETHKEIALSLYDKLRMIKKDEFDLIICEGIEREGVGIAIMDRLMRAATEIK